ncbi:MAG TPA: hypothetical protein VKE94_03645, partial [Gemmataceae bacterium]|nr:hypothetical protein [Gemmataceae bacterium]
MSAHVSPSPDPSKTELEIVINGRMIALGAALPGLLVVVAAVGLSLLGGSRSEPAAPAVAAEPTRPVTRPRAESPRVRFDPASVAALEPTARPAIEIPESVPMPSAVRETRPAQKRTPIVRAEPPEAAAPESPPLAAAKLSSARRFKRIDYLYEFEAVRQLTDVLTLDLDDATKKTLLAAKPTTTKGKDAKTEPVHALLEVAEKRGDLQGLPLRQAKDCQKKKEAALVMQALSRHFRSLDASFSRRRAGTASHLDDVKEEVALLNTLQNLDLPNQVKESARRF